MPKSDLLKGELQGDKEALAELKEKIGTGEFEAMRPAAAAGAAPQAGAPKLPGMHFIPLDGDSAAAWDSARWLEKRRQDIEDLNKRRETEDAGKYRYYLKCRNGMHQLGELPAPPHGLYFVKNPRSDAVSSTDWESTYKPRDQAWHQEIYCQVCLKAGFGRVRLPFTWIDSMEGTWLPDPRWVWKSPIDPAVWEREGDTRANDLPTAASNMWREDPRYGGSGAPKATEVVRG